MPFASATLAQRQAVRDASINCNKAIELAHDTGPLNTLGPVVDTEAAALVAALSAAGTGTGGDFAIVTDGQTATASGTGTTATFAVTNGVITVTLS